jgi:hypothetical protein
MAKFKRGDYAILDANSELNLKEYNALKVRIVEKVGWGKYAVQAVDPVVFPTTEDGHAMKYFYVSKKYLTPTTLDANVIVRYPTNLPTFSNADVLVLTQVVNDLTNNKPVGATNILRLKAITAKIRYAISFNEVNL